MKRRTLLTLAVAIACADVLAHGHTPQKVVKEWTVHAEPAKTWALVKDFGAIGRWHPAVAGVELAERDDAAAGGKVAQRTIALKDGGRLVEKLREVNDAEMKVDVRLVETTLPVSDYRSVMQVKAGPGPGESTVTWSGRFYNKADSGDAKPGEDDKAAIAAITAWYDAGAEGLRKAVEP